MRARYQRTGHIRPMSAFSPDSFIVADVVSSPIFDERKGGRRPDMILLHYTGMQSGDAALKALTTAASKVSAHYVVFEDGRIASAYRKPDAPGTRANRSGPKRPISIRARLALRS